GAPRVDLANQARLSTRVTARSRVPPSLRRHCTQARSLWSTTASRPSNHANEHVCSRKLPHLHPSNHANEHVCSRKLPHLHPSNHANKHDSSRQLPHLHPSNHANEHDALVNCRIYA